MRYFIQDNMNKKQGSEALRIGALFCKKDITHPLAGGNPPG